jgi:hypothetical protein
MCDETVQVFKMIDGSMDQWKYYNTLLRWHYCALCPCVEFLVGLEVNEYITDYTPCYIHRKCLLWVFGCQTNIYLRSSALQHLLDNPFEHNLTRFHKGCILLRHHVEGCGRV